jgi:hypothetical protein
MQILEHNISFANRLALTFNQTKRAVQLFVLAIIMIWFVVWLVEADFAGALASFYQQTDNYLKNLKK